MKINLETLVKNQFQGKIFKSSNFISEDSDNLYDVLGNKLTYEEFNPFGKLIQNVEIGFSEGREDAGMLFYFDGWTEPFFFYYNDDIEVE